MKFSIITSAYNQLEQLKVLREWLNKQSFIDFEWIIADDGSTDGTDKWAKINADKYVRHDDKGYRLTKILNKAQKEASGEFLVWIMADSYPERNFLKVLNRYVDDKSMVTGLRVNVIDGVYKSHDWRVHFLKHLIHENEIILDGDTPWRAMTLNSMCMPNKMYEEMGGIDSGYDKGYGKMDWWMASWCHFNGYTLKVLPEAIIFHEDHDDREDTENNTDLFTKHLKELQA